MNTFGQNRPPGLVRGAPLAFVETRAHVEQLGPLVREGRITGVVALYPEAAWALSQSNQPYLKLEDAYDGQRVNDLAEETLQRQIEWLDWVDAELQDRIPKFREFQFSAAHLHHYFLKLLSDGLRIWAFTFEQALKTWGPNEIYCPHSTAERDSIDWRLFFSTSLYADVLQL